MAVSLSLVAEAAAGPAQPEDAREKAEKRDCVEKAQSLFASRERNSRFVKLKTSLFAESFPQISEKKRKMERSPEYINWECCFGTGIGDRRCRKEGVVI